MVTLLILDGFGVSEKIKGNAIKLQGTPHLDKLSVFPYTTLQTSGECVGLCGGQMGNSEVGHLNMGAGRVVYQDLPKINKAIKDKTFFEKEEFLKVVNHVKLNNSNLHLMGLLSDGGVHSHINHLKALIDLADENGVKNVYIHAFLDGRDALRDSGVKFVNQIEKYANGRAKIATLCGRVYAMDRECRWERVQKAYDMLVYGKAEYSCNSAVECLQKSYDKKIFDEFVEPTIIDGGKAIGENDGVIFYNYRSDRAREITMALTQPFNKFKVEKFNNLKFSCMTEYSADFTNLLVAYPPEKTTENLSKIIADNALKQFHVAETTKYAHVTFFFNGGIEEANVGEDRKLIDSIDVQDFTLVPDMRAFEITEEAVAAIESKKYSFILINLSNPDMIGHTGNIEAAKKAVKTVDECAYKIAQKTLEAGGHCIITADHGNCEEMLDDKENVYTQHTTNPVPLWLVSNKFNQVELIKGRLSNVAPTVLKLLNIKIPDFMDSPLY